MGSEMCIRDRVISIVNSLSSQEVVMVDVFGDFLHRLLNKGIVGVISSSVLVVPKHDFMKDFQRAKSSRYGDVHYGV